MRRANLSIFLCMSLGFVDLLPRVSEIDYAAMAKLYDDVEDDGEAYLDQTISIVTQTRSLVFLLIPAVGVFGTKAAESTCNPPLFVPRSYKLTNA
jgi:hypothetical protein